MTEKEFLDERSTRIIFVDDARYAMAFIYAASFDHPAEKMITIGVTGTNGKTTVAYMIYEILKKAGYKTGLIGTVQTIIGDECVDSVMTTPEADALQEILYKNAEAGVEVVVMEVSSQALMTHRSQGFTFDIGVFTNIGTDHIGPDQCHDHTHYVYCKSLLMRQCKTGIVNIDDPYADDILKGHTCEVKTYGISSAKADLRATNISCQFVQDMPGVEFDVNDSLHIRVPMPGEYSVSNSLAAILTVKQFSVPDEVIADVLEKIYVKGRTNVIRQSSPVAIVDFAHNIVALRELLKTLRIYYTGKIIIVTGASGFPDTWERIGEVCGEMADLTVISTDECKFGDQPDIMKGIEKGVKKLSGECVIIPDRREAVRYAVSVAGENDVVAAVGRGHENHLIIKGEHLPITSDESLLLEAFDALK